jgi:alkyl hydroperoxide reductase subunit AhpC
VQQQARLVQSRRIVRSLTPSDSAISVLVRDRSGATEALTRESVEFFVSSRNAAIDHPGLTGADACQQESQFPHQLILPAHGGGNNSIRNIPFGERTAFGCEKSGGREWRIIERSPSTATREDSFMSLRINDTAPNFKAQTTQGPIDFHQWIGDKWAILFSHPKDFTPVCTTELGYMAKIEPEFTKRSAKLIGLSIDPVESHKGWVKDIEETQGATVKYPMIADTDLAVAKLYNMLPADEAGGAAGRTAATNATVRSVFIIGPDKKIKLMLTYPMTTGRNFDEILRALDSIQLTAKHKVATPVNWKQGEDVIISGSVSDEDAKKIYPAGWKAPKPYLRIVKQPH